MDFQKLIAAKIENDMNLKVRFDILFVSDESSRLSYARGITALDEFRHFYGNIANVSVVTMDSKRFVALKPDLKNFNIVWVDNVINRTFNDVLVGQLDAVLESIAPDWRKEAKSMSADDAAKYAADANEYRALHSRVIYALDEYIWEGPVSRQKNIISVKTAEDAMAIADEVVVPNMELAGAIKEIGYVAEDKEVLVIPTFMSDSFYPVNKIFHKSSSMATTIRKPKVLVKGTVIPMNVQKLIIEGTEKYDFTISSVGELCKSVMKLLENRTVKFMKHWADPDVNSRNMVKTEAIERDAAFDFTILTVPENIGSDIYNITNVDTDALMAIAGGSVAIAGVSDAEYAPGVHICVDTGLVFGKDTTPKQLDELLTKWSICTSWDSAFDSQRKLLGTKLVSSPAVMAGFFNAMLGRRVSEARKAKFANMDVELNAKKKTKKSAQVVN